VEIHHLRTAIHDNENEIAQVVADLHKSEPLLASELVHLHQSHTVVNAVHIHHLNFLVRHYGLVKQREIGIHAEISHFTKGSRETASMPNPTNQDSPPHNSPSDSQVDK